MHQFRDNIDIVHMRLRIDDQHWCILGVLEVAVGPGIGLALA